MGPEAEAEGGVAKTEVSVVAESQAGPDLTQLDCDGLVEHFREKGFACPNLRATEYLINHGRGDEI